MWVIAVLVGIPIVLIVVGVIYDQVARQREDDLRSRIQQQLESAASAAG